MVAQLLAGGAGEGGRGGGGQGGGQRLAPQGVGGAGHGAVGAEPHGQADEELGQVGLAQALGGDRGGVVEVDQPGPPVGVDDHAVAAQVAVGDARLVEAGHLLPGGLQGGVADGRRVGLLQRAAGDQPLHQQPRPVAVRPGQDHLWGADPAEASRPR